MPKAQWNTCAKKHNFYVTKYIWKKKNTLLLALLAVLFGLRGKRLLKRAKATTRIRRLRRSFERANSQLFPLFFSLSPNKPPAAQARLPCACVQMALACTALFLLFLSDYHDFFVTMGLYTVLPWADVLCGHCNGNVNLLYFSENDTRWSEAKRTNDGNSWTSLHAAL